MPQGERQHRASGPSQPQGPPPAEQVPAETLVVAAAAGDQAAWRALVGRYTPRVYALVKSRCRNHHTAEEITQSVFATLSTKLSRYDERGRFEPWLFRIAANRLRDEQRRRARHAKPTEPDAIARLHLTAEDSDHEQSSRELESLRRAIQTLNDKDREVVEMRHHGQMSFQHIAEALGQPMGTVLARHHRALKKLKAFLIDAGLEDQSPTPSDPSPRINP